MIFTSAGFEIFCPAKCPSTVILWMIWSWVKPGPFQQPALSAENQERVGDEEDASDDMEAGEGKAGGARVGGGGEQGLVEVDQGGAAGDVKHSTCHAQQCFLWMISV